LKSAITFAAAKTKNTFIGKNRAGRRKWEGKKFRKVSRFSWNIKKASYLCTPLNKHCSLTEFCKSAEDEN
jgi:hypothetical protein